MIGSHMDLAKQYGREDLASASLFARLHKTMADLFTLLHWIYTIIRRTFSDFGIRYFSSFVYRGFHSCGTREFLFLCDSSVSFN